MNFPCPVRSLCIEPANPIENLSSEGPDQEVFIGYNSGWGNFPPLGSNWSSSGCISQCESTVSQDDADLCAAKQQLICSADGGGPGHGGGGGGDGPGKWGPTYLSSASSCQLFCPDGRPFIFQIQVGLFAGTSQAQADAIAQSYACFVGEQHVLCLGAIQALCCIDQPYASTVTATGAGGPFTFTIISGSLPPGLAMDINGNITGTPIVPGNFTFTVSGADSHSDFMNKTYTIGVLGLTNSPPGATQNVAYNFTFTAAGGTPPYAFAISSGALPDGLVMNSSGVVSGTPTTAATFNFSVQITDSSS